MRNQQGRPQCPVHGSNTEIHFECISLSAGFKVFKNQTQPKKKKGHYLGQIISQRELCLVNFRMKKKTPLN